MKRKQVFQFSNQKWYPSFLKRDMYEFMTWFVGKVNAAKPFLPVISESSTSTVKLAPDLKQ